MIQYKQYSILMVLIVICLLVIFFQLSEINQMALKNTEYKETIQEMNEKMTQMADQQIAATAKSAEKYAVTDIADIEELKRKGIHDIEVIEQSLLEKPELIPYENVQGRTMYFSKVHILNYKWVYAIFEDGHTQGYALYSYDIDSDGKITWTLIDTFLLGVSN